MAIVKMKHLRLCAMLEDREILLKRLQRMGCVEIEEPSVDWNEPPWCNLRRPESDGLSIAKSGHTATQRALELLKEHCPQKNGLFPLRPEISEDTLFDDGATANAQRIVATINDTQTHMTTQTAQLAKLTGQQTALTPWLTLDLPLEPPSSPQLAVAFGSVALNATAETLSQAIGAVSELAEISLVTHDREQQFVVLFCHTSVLDEVIEGLHPFNWSRVNLSGWVGTARVNYDALSVQMDEILQDIAAAKGRIVAVAGARDALRQLEDRYMQEMRREESRARLVDSQRTFYLGGWIPAEACATLDPLVREFTCAFETSDPTPDEYPDVPISLKNNWLTRPLNMVTEMYALPAYNGLDPNPLMAPFFILFYGVMMADMGYGLLMMATGMFLFRRTRPKNGMRNFAGLALLCGMSTFVMGALTGGFFGDFIPQIVLLTTGNVVTLPSLFNPLDDALMVLMGSLVLGVIQIFTGMIISIVKQVRRGETMAAICGEGAWFAVFLTFGIGFAVGQLSIAAIVALAILVLTQGYGKKGILAKTMAILGSLYNNVTGYFSDILSYSRLMALMLAGAVIAQVFNTLGALTGNVFAFLLISMVGNTLNFGLNILGCFVHDLRLQCLEYFGRFYEDGGKAFDPLSIKTKYVDIIE